ncbi:MAG: hypothetical protein NXI21_02555 [Alphaproteobacteria bacterium]|nr:hypothetical protein [Alphaproteobacteria bacterium]
MKPSRHPAPVALALALVLSACSGGPKTPPADPAPSPPAAAQADAAVSETDDVEDCGCKRRTITPLASPIRPATPE